ncbi:MAG TPA: HD domain-containing protein [Ktedonosporobacter sp.]|nr:HD domain-containing protein [Ktedonosporobacter sp.]
MYTLATRAFLLATELHAQQKRKASLIPGVPYLSHLMEVAGMVMASGAPEIVVAAALLHDAIEDQGNRTRSSIREQLGSDVLALVEECTEQGTGGATKAPWLERKEAALLRIPTLSTFALMIRVADKLQNSRELCRNVSLRGDEAYTGFRVDKTAVLWYYREAIQAMQRHLLSLRSEHPHQPLLLLTQCWLQELHEILSFLQSQ